MSERQIETQLFQDTFLNTMALYSALKAQPSRGIRRAELKQGQVAPEAVDFLADVEIKAKRTLQPEWYKELMLLVGFDDYQYFPIDLQSQLGQVFLRNDLGCGGHYRVLYFRAKNNQLQDREEPQQFPEETISAEDILQ